MFTDLKKLLQTKLSVGKGNENVSSVNKKG
jgi:hypothetical protein